MHLQALIQFVVFILLHCFPSTGKNLTTSNAEILNYELVDHLGCFLPVRMATLISSL